MIRETVSVLQEMYLVIAITPLASILNVPFSSVVHSPPIDTPSWGHSQGELTPPVDHDLIAKYNHSVLLLLRASIVVYSSAIMNLKEEANLINHVLRLKHIPVAHAWLCGTPRCLQIPPLVSNS